MTRFTLDLCQAALDDASLAPVISVSRSTEALAEFQTSRAPSFAIDTFSSGLGALASLWRVPALRGQLSRYLRHHDVDAVVVLMSHIWTPLVASAVKRLGIPYLVIAHDAQPHPGDRTGRVLGWLLRDLRYADRVIALSQAVGDVLVADGRVERERLRVLFHPEMRAISPETFYNGRRMRFLFFGRIMAYKGLPLFVQALERLRDAGVVVDASVVGEGDLEPLRGRLLALGVSIRNAWISEADIAAVLKEHDVVVISHTEASQSGVAALALGSGLPVVATPVAGLCEQVEHERNGLLAARVDATALAEAMQRLVQEPMLMETFKACLERGNSERSMSRFVSELCSELVAGQRLPTRFSRAGKASTSSETLG